MHKIGANVYLYLYASFVNRMFTYDAEEDALGGRETGKFQAVEPVGESPRKELQVSGEAAEHSGLQQIEHGAGDIGGRTS